ncbi:beta-ketoacyl synthase N-terminal-like domain-containing protein [Amycolatopsis sp. NPDC059657]|uniref:beta-ketoacyl synthase N-terminal-like domain-containing protein n=1 Tax=Amycolatopsis sp. NPDC059657 TaxID=3346899 RepID=UPI003670CE1D
MRFEPIAIVGRGAVLPGALGPDAFWANIEHGRTSLGPAPDGRWRVPRERMMTTPDAPEDGTWSDIGGYVRGFEFDPAGFAIDTRGLDPQVEWVLHGVREALREAGQEGPAPKAGLVLGNLSFPTAGMAAYAEQVWRGAPRSDARNRFMSGLPAHLAAQALGLGVGAFSLDAACASSLYAIKLACDRLHDRGADLMVAGAVNCADDLFIHVGFSALSALSRTGRSRPFHRGADGLVPAEGAAFVALMRLSDVTDQPVLGVIRGVGLSNDGRGAGFLAPAEEGQQRAMRLAYEMAGVAPETVSLLECHATGTAVGDAVEVRSAAKIFADHKGLAVGSAKSNVGHLITAAGVAGLLKVIGAMRAGVRPATLNADAPIDALDGTPLRLLHEPEPWTGPRRAAISAFGFGGNNAHLIVDDVDVCGAVDPLPPKQSEPIAIVAIGARVGNGENSHDLREALFSGTGDTERRETVDVKLTGLRVPPLDLKQTLAQQLLMLEAAREAVKGLDLPRERTMVLVGMGCDPEVARYGARWRAEDGDAFTPVLTSAGVVGTMPNIVANRLNSHLDLAGPSFTVSAEEASGIVALEIAARALRTGEADAAVVGAVDLSHEPVHQQALKDLGLERKPGDAAVVLVLKRLSDADKSEVIALVEDATSETDRDLDFDPGELFGNPHAAKGLLAVATAALALRHRATPRVGAPADPAFDVCAAEVSIKPLAGKEKRVLVKACTSEPWVAERPAKLRVYSGADKKGVIQALDAGRESDTGPARLVLLGDNDEAAKRWLISGGPKPEGVAFRETPLTGEIGFVFTGGISAYPGMGRELLLAFPDLLEEIETRSGSVREAAAWAFDGSGSAPRTVLDQIWGTALLSQVHARVSRDLLGLKPTAALGYSAGESNALVALGVWTDMRALIAEMNASGMFTREVAGEFAAIHRAWARAGIAGTRWKNYLVGVEPDLVRKALDGEVAAHLIAINSPDSCLIGGDVPACERVLGRLDTAYTLPVPYELAVHTPELAEVRGQWWRLHNRPATPPDGVRFYSCATTGSYLPTAERAADALTAQAVGTMDFAGTVERAWDDGVRIFLEHGPKALCTDWIRRTLGDREHLAIPLDAQDGRSVRQLSRVAAELVAAGVPVNTPALFDRLAASLPAENEPDRVVTLPAHLPEIKVPETTMARAPHLPPVLSTVDTKGPLFDRKQLEHLAVGKISDLFGELFTAQDGYARQTRMPSPPMLLADRVIAIDAVAGSMGTGTIRTETDVEPGSWYLDSTGRMPPGVLVEAGQADLLLISWLGADLLNRGERVYRLLGCELTFHGSPPKPGEKLEYEIHIDDHAELNGIRLFFFHYDCHVDGELRLSVRKGQAGFFTDQELAASAGVIWDPSREEPPSGRLDPPAITGAPRRYDADAVRAFAEGRPADCFGKAWDVTRSHSRSPRIDDGDLLFLREVTDFEPAGGPWRRGYLRAETPITTGDWFFEGHFKNDPCMPGTLMFQGCLQSMAFYLAACGFTIGNDAWRFEPVPGEAYDLRCRGQVTPAGKNLAYEVFVIELSAGPNPTVFADVLCTVDGVKAFHAKRVGLRLVPDWPLEQWRDRLLAEPETGVVAEVDGVRFGYESLLSCAWGKPSGAFGELYSRFDGHRRVARLPGPPYHFMTRIAETTGKLGGMEVGSSVVADYEVPDRVWYFDENHGTMPLAVLMEVALQPCGWLASFAGCAVEIDDDLLFRNLDGDGMISGYITPETKVIRTHATLRDISVTGTMIIVSFDVECFADDASVFKMDTVFGFFPKSAFEDQQGLRASDVERAAIAAPPGPVIDLASRPEKYCGGPLRLAGPMLLMLDRVTGYDPAGGEAGLGRLSAEKDVDAGEWFFKAHFFQDPVQPGSLGIEAMYQLLQFYLIERGAGAGMTAPRFEALTADRPLVWKYRGQVIPTHGVISTELEITEFGGDHARAKAWLWVDGKRIYSAVDLGVRVVEGDPAGEEVLDAGADTWLNDHRPTWTVPALPMMSVVDRLAPDSDAFVLEDIELRRWLPATRPIRLKSEKDGEKSTLLAWRDAATPKLSRFEPVATATIGTPGPPPQTLAPLANVETVTGFYTSGSLFHGPAFQYLKSLRRGSNGASGVLDAGQGSVPRGRLNQGLLDAATHVIPHDSLWQWVSSIPSGQVAYPCRISRFEQFAPLPDTGEIQVEARFAGLDGRFPLIDLQLIAGGRVLVAMRLVEVLMPTGSFGTAAPEHRRAFLRDRTYVDGLGLSRTKAGSTTLTLSDVEQCDWLVGTVAQVYGLPPSARGRDHLVQIAVRDHVARQARVHPSAVDLGEDPLVAHVAGTPYRVELEHRAEAVIVRN